MLIKNWGGHYWIESEVYLGLKISDHVKRVREELSMRALWEQSLVYTCRVSTSGKNYANIEETMAILPWRIWFSRK